jgi:hypothetical protein
MEHGLFALLLEAMALRRADTRQEFIDAEGLGDVIVSAAIERFDLGGFLFPCRKDNDRQIRAALPYSLNDIKTVHVWQT